MIPRYAHVLAARSLAKKFSQIKCEPICLYLMLSDSLTRSRGVVFNFSRTSKSKIILIKLKQRSMKKGIDGNNDDDDDGSIV
jgi:hypothetical protein